MFKWQGSERAERCQSSVEQLVCIPDTSDHDHYLTCLLLLNVAILGWLISTISVPFASLLESLADSF